MTKDGRPPVPASLLAIDDHTGDDRALFRLVGPHQPTVDGERAEFTVHPTDYGRGPWDHGILHGGPVVGLTAWASEHLADSDELLCARLTVELHHGVPVDELRVTASVVRRSRRSVVIDVSVRHRSTVVARSSSQWLAPSHGWDTDWGPRWGSTPPMPPRAADPGRSDFDYPRPGFNCDTAELRYVSGSNEVTGPAVIWARLTSPLIAGVPTSAFVRVATIADLAAAAGFERGVNDEAFINADVTLQLDRVPTGEWLGLDARTHRSAGGIGHNEATVFDEAGPFGRVLQSLVESPRDLAVQPGTTGGRSRPAR